MKRVISSCELNGSVVVPSSKSDGQRAILAAGLSKGVTVLYRIGDSDDEQVMLRNIFQLGAGLESSFQEVTEIKGIQEFPKQAEINAGESGLGMR